MKPLESFARRRGGRLIRPTGIIPSANGHKLPVVEALEVEGARGTPIAVRRLKSFRPYADTLLRTRKMGDAGTARPDLLSSRGWVEWLGNP